MNVAQGIGNAAVSAKNWTVTAAENVGEAVGDVATDVKEGAVKVGTGIKEGAVHAGEAAGEFRHRIQLVSFWNCRRAGTWRKGGSCGRWRRSEGRIRQRRSGHQRRSKWVAESNCAYSEVVKVLLPRRPVRARNVWRTTPRKELSEPAKPLVREVLFSCVQTFRCR